MTNKMPPKKRANLARKIKGKRKSSSKLEEELDLSGQYYTYRYMGLRI